MKQTACTLSVCLLLALGLFSPTPVQAEGNGPFEPDLVVLGDSLSDQGNVSALTQGLIPPPCYYFNGRFTNGKNWVDYVERNMRLQVANYAFGAALSGTGSVDPRLGHTGLLSQLAMFQADLQSGALAIGPDTQCVVWCGSNDLLGIQTPDQAPIVIQGIVGNLAQTVGTLLALGFDEIIVCNLPDVGLTPAAQSQGPDATAGATASAAGANQALRATLDSLFPCQVTWVDMFRVTQVVAQHARAFGITQLSTSYLPPFYDGSVDPNFVPGPIRPRRYYFYDPIHPTTKVHAIFAVVMRAVLRDRPVRPWWRWRWRRLVR